MLKKTEKARICSLRQLAQLFSHTDTYIITNHVSIVGKSLFFEVDNVAISEAQIAFWVS